MKIMNNALLGRNLSFYGMSLNTTGLYYLNKDANCDVRHRILLTLNPAKVVGLMGMDFDEVDEANEEEFFQMLIACPFFKKKYFKEDFSNGKNLSVERFTKLINSTEFDPAYEKITMEMLFEYFKEEKFKEQYDRSREIIRNLDKIQKVDGKLILKHLPSYDKTKFSTTLPYFYESFILKKDKLEADDLLMNKPEEELVEMFLEVTKNI